MTWQDILKVAGTFVAILAVFVPIILLAMDERNRKKFASKSTVCDEKGDPRFLSKHDASGWSARLDEERRGMQKELDSYKELYVRLDDRVGELEAKVAVMEERQLQEWRQITKEMSQVAETIKSVATQMTNISEGNQKLALTLERMRGERRRTQPGVEENA